MAVIIAPEPFQFGKPEAGSQPSSAEMRRLLAALAQNNLTRDPKYPENPRDGMMRVNATNLNSINVEMYLQGVWVVLLANIATSAPWPFHSEHEFLSASVSWLVNHGRGRKPIVQVIDSGNQIITPASIVHTTDNQLTITHGSAIVGRVIVIG